MLVPRTKCRLGVIFVQHFVQQGDLCFKIFREELRHLVAGSEEINVHASQRIVENVRVCGKSFVLEKELYGVFAAV